MTDGAKKRIPYQIIRGILVPISFRPECFRETLDYKPRPDDVIIDTFPKAGTTWMQFMATHIYRKGVPVEDPLQFSVASPFIDRLGNAGIERMPRPGVLKTHLPFTHVPYSAEAKYIYVVRNPFDTCVSLYHHTRRPNYWDGEFDDFFEYFMNGEVEYNDYFDHLLSWYPHLKDQNVFYTTYEDMKKDTKSVVLRLATFIGKEYSETIEKDNSVLNNILHYTSFDYMKGYFDKVRDSTPTEINLLKNSHGKLDEQIRSSNPTQHVHRIHIVRKGIVGDWINHFSSDQKDRMRRKLDEKAKHIDLKLIWP